MDVIMQQFFVHLMVLVKYNVEVVLLDGIHVIILIFIVMDFLNVTYNVLIMIHLHTVHVLIHQLNGH